MTRRQGIVKLSVLSGEDAPGARLSKSSVEAIKRQLANGVSAQRVAASYGVTYQTVYLIGTGQTWADVGPPGRLIPSRKRISTKTRDEIATWKKRHAGETLLDIAARFEVSKSAVSRALSDAYALAALRAQRDLLSSGNYDAVAKKHEVTADELDRMLDYVSAARIPEKIKKESE